MQWAVQWARAMGGVPGGGFLTLVFSVVVPADAQQRMQSAGSGQVFSCWAWCVAQRHVNNLVSVPKFRQKLVGTVDLQDRLSFHLLRKSKKESQKNKKWSLECDFHAGTTPALITETGRVENSLFKGHEVIAVSPTRHPALLQSSLTCFPDVEALCEVFA